MKILALLGGLKLAKGKGLSNLLVEKDSTMILCWMNRKKEVHESSIGGLAKFFIQSWGAPFFGFLV